VISSLDPGRLFRWGMTLAILALVLGAGATGVLAGTTGRIMGSVLDSEGKPIAAATVRVVGTSFGAYSSADGRFQVLNIPSGVYEISVSRLGYESTVVREVLVSADETTNLEVRMVGEDVRVEEVVVTATRPPVEIRRTSSKATVTSRDIESLPVQELKDIVDLQAGVVDGHFRGGRIGEVQYQVDGVSVNNAFNNESSLKIDRSLLQEVQVISGTFDAEYGQAMSGVVNAVLKQGTPDFRWEAEALVGGFFYPESNDRIVDEPFRPNDNQNYQATLRGPLPLKSTFFLLNARHSTFDDYVIAERRFRPTDDVPAGTADFQPSGDWGEEPLAYSREWSGAAKLTTTAIEGLKLNYQAIFNRRRFRAMDWAFRYNPEGLSKKREFSVAHGFDATWTLSPTTYWDISGRQNYLEYEDFVYESPWDPRYDAAGPADVDDRYEPGAVVQGVQFTRYRQLTDNRIFKSSLVSQLSPEHLVKVGGEFSLPHVEFGTPGYLVYTQVGNERILNRYFDRPPDYPGIRGYDPVIGAAFVQDQMELPDLIVRAGLRFEYFNPRATLPSDLSNPANSIAGAPESLPEDVPAKVYLSPRLGVSYPIEDYAAIHFSYGHFRQFPALDNMYSNADYDALATLQAGVDPGVFGNPDLEPEKTVQYEIGYTHAVNSDLGFDVTTFYKDIRDLLGVEYIATYNDARYPRFANVDFGNVVGFTFSLEHRRLGPVRLALDYSWQRGLGNASDPLETYNRAEAGEDARPRLVPFDWDQQHTFNATLSWERPGMSVSSVIRVASGQPYTPILDSGFGNGLEKNIDRKPYGTLVDLRVERDVRLAEHGFQIFGRVFNLFDTRYFGGDVFASTGTAEYSRFPFADRVRLADPTRFYPPRRIELGIRLDSEVW
jgi:outer membrane receptor protein involved in Fe transport